MRHAEYLNMVSPYADFNEAHEWRDEEATGDEICELCGARLLMALGPQETPRAWDNQWRGINAG